MATTTEPRVLARRKDDVMVRPDLADVTLLLDRSGSMGGDEDNTIEGINKVIHEQQAGDGEAAFSLVQFDNEYEVNYEAKPIKECKFLTRADYIPRGGTHLFSSIMKTVAAIDARFAAAPKDNKPGRVMLFIVTDGGENEAHATREVDWEAISKVLENRREQQGWTIAFIGCDEKGMDQAKQAGVAAGNNMAFSKGSYGNRGMKVAMAKMSRGMSNLRAADYGTYSGQSGAQGYQGATGYVGTQGLAANAMFNAAADMSVEEEKTAAEWKAPDPSSTIDPKNVQS